MSGSSPIAAKTATSSSRCGRSVTTPSLNGRVGKASSLTPGSMSGSGTLADELDGQAAQERVDLGRAVGRGVGQCLDEQLAAGGDDAAGHVVARLGDERGAVLAGEQAALAQLADDLGDAL